MIADKDTSPPPERKTERFVVGTLITLAVCGVVLLIYYLGSLPPAETGQAAPVGFFDRFTPALWFVLFVNVATLVSAGAAAYAALRVTPSTSRAIADQTDATTRSAIDVARESASAAELSALAARDQAAAAVRAAEDTGVHAIARLRQGWIDELRSRVAQAHSLLANALPPPGDQLDEYAANRVQRTIEANEVMAKIELLLNPGEEGSKALMQALNELQRCGTGLSERQAAGGKVVTAAQVILKTEWDRVKRELRGEPEPEALDEKSVENASDRIEGHVSNA